MSITPDTVREWGYGERRADTNTGIRTGEVVAIDIDCYNEALANRLQELALDHFGGEPPIRIGQWPKRLMCYRTAVKRDKRATGKYALPGLDDKAQLSQIEVLGDGQQLVAYGEHPVTRKPYQWIGVNGGEKFPRIVGRKFPTSF
ncbi:MAG TPA: bifunctional DNA primase/polymerase, partial [Roseiarcus sp.]